MLLKFWNSRRETTSVMGNATSAGLGSEAPHDQRDISFARGHNSDTRPDTIELAEEAD